MRIKTFQKYTSRKFWRNKTVLITGINGFVGGNLAKHLLSCGAIIIGITNSNKKNKFLKFENIIDKIKLHTVDIKNYDKLSKIFSLYKIDICFHLAAQVDVNIARLNPYNTFETNIKGTYNLLELLRNHDSIKSIIIASSDKAYGEYKSQDLPYTEKHDLRPIYPYDVSKASADLISKSYSSNLYKMPIIITRFANIFGPGQLNFTALIPDCILANLGYRKFIPRGSGINKRDFLFVDDVSDLYICLAYNLCNEKKFIGEVYNAGTGDGYRVKDIIKKICSLNNNKKLYDEIKKDLRNKKLIGEITHQFMNHKKISKDFNWMPKHNLADGLMKSIIWYKKFLKTYSYKYFIDK